MYEYGAKVKNVVDGDTVDLVVDVGLETERPIRVRLASINAAETNSPDPAERVKAQRAKRWLTEKLMLRNAPVMIRTYKDKKEKYGRYLVEIQLEFEDTTVNQQMVDLDLAVPYMVEKVVTSPPMPQLRKRHG